MVYAWLAIPFLIAILDWIAIKNNWTIIHAFAKQGVMIGLIAWSWFATSWHGFMLYFGLALVFSWAGDVFLLSPRYFLPGLVAFLCAHIAYLLGLNLAGPILSAITAGILIAAGLMDAIFYPRIRDGLRKKPATAKLRIPVMVYGFILSAMMFSAISTLFRSDWAVWTAFLVTAGGILFFVSDNYLARDRFVYPIRNGQLIVMVTYHLAQIALIAGAVLHFS